MNALFLVFLLQGNPFAHPSDVANMTVASSVTCNNTCAADLLCDRFENANDATWVRSGLAGNWNFINQARGSCSSYFWRLTSTATGDRQTWTGSDTAVTYATGWFRVSTDSLPDTSSVRVIVGNMASSTTIWYLRLGKTGTQLYLLMVDHVASTYTSQNISANVWYHWGVYWNNTANAASWYLTTTDSLGAAIDTTAPSTTRSLGQLVIGRGTEVNSPGNVGLDFDSTTINSGDFSQVEY